MDKLLQDLVEISEKAGLAILKHYQKDNLEVVTKEDDSPVTIADFSAHEVIKKMLTERYPEIAQLSEEAANIDFKQRSKWNDYFLIDPLDGTKEFIKGSGEFTVNIAYMKNNEPVAGVVHLPVLSHTYIGDINESFVIRNEEKTKIPNCDYEKGKLRIVASKSHSNEATINYIENLRKHYIVEAHSFGSSLKICKVAEGIADLNPRLGPTSEWDIAAAHAILIGAGGDIYKYGTRERVDYNKESFLNPHFECMRAELKTMELL